MNMLKKPLLTFCFLLTACLVQAQTFEAADVEAVDKQFDEGFKKKDAKAVFKNVADDAIFYGTDPTDKWSVAVFRKRVEKDIHTSKYNITTVSRTIIPVAGGSAAVIIKQISWPYFSTLPLREVVVYEKANGWKLKSFSVTIMLPDEYILQLNEMVSSPAAKK